MLSTCDYLNPRLHTGTGPGGGVGGRAGVCFCSSRARVWRSLCTDAICNSAPNLRHTPPRCDPEEIKTESGQQRGFLKPDRFPQHSPLLISRFHKLVFMEFMQFTHAWLYNFSPFLLPSIALRTAETRTRNFNSPH